MNRNRVITNQDIENYKGMVEQFIWKNIAKNWKEAKPGKTRADIPLGNSGYTINDIRQHLRAELVIALYKYNPDYKTAEGKSVKESTFVFHCLNSRVGQLCKKLTKSDKYGYGIRMQNFEETFGEFSWED